MRRGAGPAIGVVFQEPMTASIRPSPSAARLRALEVHGAAGAAARGAGGRAARRGPHPEPARRARTFRTSCPAACGSARSSRPPSPAGRIPHRGRADDGAGRHHPGRHPRLAGRHAPRVGPVSVSSRRPGRCRRVADRVAVMVRRAHRRNGPGARGARVAGPPYTRGLLAQSRARTRRQTGRDSGAVPDLGIFRRVARSRRAVPTGSNPVIGSAEAQASRRPYGEVSSLRRGAAMRLVEVAGSKDVRAATAPWRRPRLIRAVDA